jgi:hypothetical protein
MKKYAVPSTEREDDAAQQEEKMMPLWANIRFRTTNSAKRKMRQKT